MTVCGWLAAERPEVAFSRRTTPKNTTNGWVEACMRSCMTPSKLDARVLFGAAALAALGFAAVTRAVARGSLSRFDRRAKRAVHTARDAGAPVQALTLASKASTPIGKWWGYVPPSLVTAFKLERDGRTAAAVTIAGTSVIAALLPPILDRAVRRRLPPPERRDPSKQSYPSGHALQTSAMALAVGYVMHRERLAKPRWLVPLGPLSLLAGAGRLLLDRHWASDVLGGYCAGIALGAASAGCYELARGRSDFEN